MYSPQVLRGLLKLVRKHRVALDANYMTLVMNVLCLEGSAYMRHCVHDHMHDRASPAGEQYHSQVGSSWTVALQPGGANASHAWRERMPATPGGSLSLIHI